MASRSAIRLVAKGKAINYEGAYNSDDWDAVGDMFPPLVHWKVENQQFALDVDEHGAVDGIVTLEDLLEEVVGEIYDDTDRDVMAVQHGDDGDMLLPGTFPIHDLPDIGVNLDERPGGDYITIAGLVIAMLGHVPTRAGEKLHALMLLLPAAIA